MRAGIAEAEAEPPADIGLVFENAYGNPPPGLADDLAELRRILGGPECLRRRSSRRSTTASTSSSTATRT